MRFPEIRDEPFLIQEEPMPAYTETLLVFDGFDIDLRKPVPAEARDSMAALGLDGPFGIVTPFNPRGIDQPDEVNSDNMRRFEEELLQSKREYVRVDGCSPDRSHCECSVAIIAPIDDVLAIARHWGQLAIYWWDGEAFWLHNAMNETDPLRLPPANAEDLA
jgi:hypothetical protein